MPVLTLDGDVLTLDGDILTLDEEADPARRRAILGFPRVTDQFTLSGGSWNASYPIANLQVLPLSQIARSTDLNSSSTLIIATSAITRRVGLLGLARHNLSLTAQIRLRLYSDAAMATTPLYDSGFADVWPEVYVWGELEWEDDNFWTGKYLESELARTTWLWIWRGAVDYMAAAIRIDIADPDNLDGYVQAGYLEIATQYQVTYNMQYGASYGHRFRSLFTEAWGGAKYFDSRTKPRAVKGTFKSPRDEALSKHFEIRRQLDLVLPILWVPEPETPRHWLRTAMLARLTDPGFSVQAQFALDDVLFAFEEIIG